MDESPPEPDPAEPQSPSVLVCPQCAESVDPVSGPVAECPHCGAQFFVTSNEVVEEDSQEQEQRDEAEMSREDELSELRIRQLSRLGRANYRTRSYLFVGVVAFLWIMFALLSLAWQDAKLTHHFGLWPTAYCLFALAALLWAIKFARRTMEVQREINANRHARELEELEAARNEPDLSTLSDGSHRARNLERMAEGSE